MARDLSLENSILMILNRLSPTPLRERTLIREVEIDLHRLLITADFTDTLKYLEYHSLIARGKGIDDLPNCWITDTGKAYLRS